MMLSVISKVTVCWYGFNKKIEAIPPEKKAHAITVIGEYFWFNFSGRIVSANIPNAQAIPQNRPSGVMARLWMFPCVAIRKMPPNARTMHNYSTRVGSFFLRMHA